MEFIYGLLTSAVFFLCLLFFFYLGTRYAKQKPPDKEVDVGKKREIEQFNKEFKALFNYDVEKALQRKKVT
jgi:hypothetical protein